MARSKRKPVQDQTAKLLEEGGMLDEGGTVDPASGNEVPTGSLQEEVRDDIPAQLSEGEFVFPADVVRFIGLERLMQMRQAAKRGLAQMDNMGQMGNADEATMDDGEDTEFETEIDDILAEVESEANQGTA
jgi:Arc/MetJ-type ribon-helix-helix transcriptional regulator